MNRRTFIRNSLGAAAMLPFRRAQPRPNIVICVADDQSYPHTGASGCSWVRTPGFDRVAEQGLLFSRAYTPNAKCAPSRSCLLTGRNSWQLEAAANHIPYFPARFGSFVESLEQGGYFAGFTGKGWAPGEPGNKNGAPRRMTGIPFQSRKVPTTQRFISATDYSGNFADFLRARPAGRPFCFWYGSHEPHRPYEYGSGSSEGKRMANVGRVPSFWPDNEVVRTDLLDYAREVEHFDDHVVRILRFLQDSGELENTLVIVTADNGMPFPRVKGQCYELSTHMPMAMMWKAGISSPGRSVDDFVSFIDLAPTLLDVAGVSAPTGVAPMQGRTLTGLLQSPRGGRIEVDRDHVLVGKERHDVGRPHDWGYPIRGIVQENFLYLRNFETDRWPAGNPETGYLNCDGSPTKTICIRARTDAQTRVFWELAFGKRSTEELYDIHKDPDCVRNLADRVEHKQLRNALQKRLFAELEQQGDPRMEGKGNIFDEYPYADEKMRGFYERFMKGEKLVPGWVNPTDFDKVGP